MDEEDDDDEIDDNELAKRLNKILKLEDTVEEVTI